MPSHSEIGLPPEGRAFGNAFQAESVPVALLTPDFKHIPALDGLRACAVLLVLVAHFGFYKVVPGGFGVTLFFFISGFLITRLLMAEFREAGRISIGGFYARRMLRLYPALLVTVALSYVTYAHFTGHVIWADILAALLYVSNYYNLYVRFGSGYAPDFSSLVHIGILWSLAVEEQYYLMFPLMFGAFASHGRKFVALLIGVAVACLLWRLVLATSGAASDRIYSGTDTRLDSILYGALLTALLAGIKGNDWKAALSHPASVCVAGVALLFTFVYRDPFFRDTLRYTIQGLALMPIVTSLCFDSRSDWIRKFLELRPMRLLGAWSYSLYLFHQLALTYAESATRESYLDGFGSLSLNWYLIAVPLSFALACGSYYLVERPFLNLRHRFGSRANS